MRLINAGINDLPIFHKGWYGLEKSPEGILFRASSADARLKIPDVQGRCKMCLLFSARPEHTGEPLRIIVKGANGSSFDFTVSTNHWSLREGTIQLDESGIIQFHIENPWSPDTLYHNGDVRSLGIMLSAIRISQLPPINSNSIWALLQEAKS